MRYLRTLILFWSTALSAEMEYRTNFLLTTLTSVLGLVGAAFTLSLFYRHGYAFEGWTWQQALLVMGLYTVLDGFSASFLAPNLSRIVNHVRDGTLDFVLLKPIDSQFWVSLRNCSPWGLPTMVVGLSMVIYGGVHHQPHALPLRAYLQGLAPALLGVVVLYSIWFVLGAMTIWFVKIYNATEALRAVLEAGKFPIQGYAGLWRTVFTFLIPVAFMTTVPAQAILGRASGNWLLAAALLAIALFTGSRWFWRFALRYYTSASS
jgi:ABC-2 type transport system permease protein